MGNGYTRQSAAQIATGQIVQAGPVNDEFNALQSAFNTTSGHSHDGTTGGGPKISLLSSIIGILPVINGGIGGLNKLDATTGPTVNDDTSDGYVVGSLWADVTNDYLYVCIDSSAGAAIWVTYQEFNAALNSIANLTTSANQMIYTTASDVYAATTLTPFARTILDDADAATVRGTIGLGSMATQNSTSVSISGGSISGITDLAVADGGTGASTASNARTNLGLGSIATQDSSNVTITGGSVSGITDITIADGGTGASTAPNARTNLGLGNVDNTSDLNKPVSTATQTALNLKQGISSRGTITSGYRNKIINPGFAFYQRAGSLGTSIGSGSSGYLMDRWFVSNTAGISCAGAVNTSVTGASIGNYYASFAFTGTGITGSNVRHRVEGVSTLQGKTVTLSFYCADSVATQMSVSLNQVFGTGGSSPVTVSQSITTMNTTFGTYYKLVFTVPSIAGKTVGANNYLEILFVPTIANAHTFSLARVSLVEGDASGEDDPYSERHIADEFNLCLRYFEYRSFEQTGYRAAGNPVKTIFSWGIRKRVSPTITTFSGTTTNITSANISANTEGFWSTGTATALGYIRHQKDFCADAEIY